jgi:hypothetical protein
MQLATQADPSVIIRQEREALPSRNPPASQVASAAQFVSQYLARILAISALVLTPCFWHSHIEAGDLASHTYNAWLAQLIVRGQAPGLWLARQWDNILFDVTLTGLGHLFALRVAEKVAVSAAVLVFFWGAFAVVAAATRRAPWFLVPCLAMIAYGWTFEMGFLNYYISLGLSFFGVAIFWRGQGWEKTLAVAVLPLTWLAHPLGTAVLLGAGAYVAIAQVLRARLQPLSLAGAGALLVYLRLYLDAHYAVRWAPGPRYFYNGLDQLQLYGPQYRIVWLLLLGLVAVCLVADAIGHRLVRGHLVNYFLPLQLYGAALLGAYLLPTAVRLPQYGAPLNLLTERLTSVCAVLACCVLGTMKPQKWHLAGFAAVATVFFFLLYQDTAKIDTMESKIEHYAASLAPGQRVTDTIWPFPGSRVFITHIVDRACVEHCFSYGNYEPSTRQFRVRALPKNPIVVADFGASDAIQMGTYVVRPQDLPMIQIQQCDSSMIHLCARPLSAGEANGQYGLQPVMR